MFAKIKSLVTEGQGRYPRLFFKEIGEMGHFFEAQAVGDFRYIPGGLLQQDFSFLADPAGDNLGRGFAGGFQGHRKQVQKVFLESPGHISLISFH